MTEALLFAFSDSEFMAVYRRKNLELLFHVERRPDRRAGLLDFIRKVLVVSFFFVNEEGYANKLTCATVWPRNSCFLRPR